MSNTAFCDGGKKTGGVQSGSKRTTFSENKQWEQRLNERLRSASEVQMVSPVSGTKYEGKKIDFEWTNGSSQKLFLGLLNNENKEIYYQQVTGNRTSISTSDINLKPGLYYWVLESEEEILTLGKFFYKKK